MHVSFVTKRGNYMRTNHIYIARDGKSGMHVLVRILAVDDIGVDYPPIDPDNFNKLMMARDVKSLVLAARDLGPMYISADILSRRTFIPSHLQQDIECGFNLIPPDLESLLSISNSTRKTIDLNNNPDRHKYFSENGAEMLQTVAIRTPKHLCIKDNSLIIREKGSSIVLGKIALSDIWVIIIDNPQVTMTSALISGINDAGIGVLYCGSDHMPNGLALPLGAHSRHAEIVEHQLAISKPLRNQIWKRIVSKKIENQAKTLTLCFGDSAEAKKIRGYAQEVQSNDKTNRESAAASEYFKALLPYGTRWNGPMTAPLNYGYAILRSGIAQCAVSHGWLVSRGIHHHSAENAFNLVDDLIEPFRPIVDLKVVSDNILEPLSTLNKKALTEVTSILVSIDGRRHSVQTAIDIYCESLRRAVELKDVDQLLLPDIIGLECETYEEKRAKGKV